MVPRGLEPRTLRLLAVRSNQLSYETNDDFEEDHLILAEIPNQMADEHMMQHSACNLIEYKCYSVGLAVAEAYGGQSGQRCVCSADGASNS